MATAELITAFIALFVVIDPIGLAPLFIALTAGESWSHRRAIATRACIVAFGLLTIFGLAGENVLHFMGISLSAFRIAGGILLLLTALDMLFERRTQRRQGQADNATADDPSVFPLAMPLLAGPGAMATMILLAGQSEGAGEMAIVLAVMASVLFVAFLLFLLSGPVERILGPVGINVVTRILGMLLAALAVQFMIDGMQELALF